MTGNKTSKGVITLNPLTKLLFIFVSGTILVGIVPMWAEWYILLCGILLLLNYGYIKTGVEYLLLFSAMWLFDAFLTSTEMHGAVAVVLLIFQVTRKFIPCLMMGTVFLRTTTISELMALSKSIKIPYKFLIPLAVVIRFFPTLKEEWESIRMAMKMRGIGFNPEYVLVPLMNSAMKISDELSAAALSRGLGSVEVRTNVCSIRMIYADWILVVSGVLFMVNIYFL